MKDAGYPRARDLTGAGVYEAKSAEHAELPRRLLEQIARAAPRINQIGPYKRWFQRPIGGNSTLQVQLKDEEFFAPHRAYAASQLTRAADKKSAMITTLELASRGFHDVRPPASMLARIGVNSWPQVFFAWVEGISLYVRKMFTGDEVRALTAGAWEFFENHPRSRMFRPVDVILVTLFYPGVLSASLLERWANLHRKFAGCAVFRLVDTTYRAQMATIERDRYYLEKVPCLYVEIQGTSQMKRVTGALQAKTMESAVTTYLP